MRSSVVTAALSTAALALGTTVVISQDRAAAPKGPPLLKDYISFSVTAALTRARSLSNLREYSVSVPSLLSAANAANRRQAGDGEKFSPSA